MENRISAGKTAISYQTHDKCPPKELCDCYALGFKCLLWCSDAACSRCNMQPPMCGVSEIDWSWND